MRFKKRKSKIVSGLAVFGISSCFILGSLGQGVHITKAVNYSKVDEILANLSTSQREALNQLSTSDSAGPKISPNIDLTTSIQTNVIVEFANKPAKIAQIQATSEGKQLSNSAATNLAKQDHAIFTNDIEKLLIDNNSKSVKYKIKRSYTHSFNGVSMTLPANQVQNLLKSKAVKKVWSNETFSIDPPAVDDTNDQLKADEFNVANYSPYDALDKLHKEGFTGKGIKVGILDTGIDYQHPDLKDAYKGGFDFVDNDNDPMETTYADWKKSGKPEISSSSTYYTEHGTHVAGIIGGRGVANSEYKMVGAAPEADIYSYRVLGPYGGGTTENIIAALDKAVSDEMDVINMSLGAALNDPLYATSVAVNNTVLSGVTTVVAAGNSGDKMYTLGSPGSAAFALTVGASSVAINLYQYTGVQNGQNYHLRELAQNYTDDLSMFKGQKFQLVDVGIGNLADYNGKDVNGKIAFIKRGSIALIDKIKNAKAKGALGVIMYNDEVNKAEGAIQSFLGESIDAIPTFSVTNEEGLAIASAIKSGTSDFTFGEYSKVQTASDELAPFSSRGPSKFNFDIKPEVTAPGVSILSTVPFYMNNKVTDGTKPEDYKYAYDRLSGTSMATPFVSGVSALLLQSNKDLEPFDVKTILMNTADPLSKDYSVFEIGSGRVDAYEAIHSNVEFEVVDKTPTIINGKQKMIKELTGGMSFGSYGFNEQDISDFRNITLKNRSEKAKTFSVSVKFQKGLRGSLDAAKNKVTLSGPTSIKLKGITQKTIKFNLNIPKTAEKGTYEGYVTFTNTVDPTETYQIPFGGRLVEEGIATFNLFNPLMSDKIVWPDTALPTINANFTLKSQMRNLDLVLQDTNTGQDIGYIGSINPILMNENQQYLILKAFSGVIYPFTGDPNNPIGNETVLVPKGHYKLRLIGTNDKGKTFSAAQDILFESGAPNVTTSFDSLDQKVIEYADQQLDSKGEMIYDFNINVNDPEIEEAKQYGIQVDQSKNGVVAFYNSGFPLPAMSTDKNGDYKDQILVTNKIPFLKVSYYAFDAARNASQIDSVAFTKNTTPYYYLKANKKQVTNGESVKYTVRSNNIKKLKTSKIAISLGNNTSAIENVTVNEAVKEYGDAEVTMVTSPASATSTNYLMTFTYLGDKELPEDIQLFDFDIKTLDGYEIRYPLGGNISATSIDQSNVESKNVFNYFEVPTLKMKTSALTGSIRLEGTLNPATNQTDFKIDQTTIGAKITLTSYDGQSINVPFTSKNGGIGVDGFKADSKPYTLTFEAPGHFTKNVQLIISDQVRGETIGRTIRYLTPIMTAGDANKDHVIDVLDALQVQTFWGTNKASVDFNFDKVVDAKDMNYIVKNFGLRNSSVPNAPNVKTSYKGINLNDILLELGIK